MTTERKQQFQARLDNQKAQLERHGNFAEVVIRTTPEGTDMINFARLWEYTLVQADRQTRGFAAKTSRDDFEQTRKDFEDSLAFMVEKLKACQQRHQLKLDGTNFISRVAQRYDIVEKNRKVAAAKDEVKTPTPKTAVAEQPPEAKEVSATPTAAPVPDDF